VQPTNFDLVRFADAIVVATALDEYSARRETDVRFRVDEVLKGPAPNSFWVRDAGLGEPPPSDPGMLAEPNPQAGDGGCIRYIFAKERSYVVFLARLNDGTWVELEFPFTRVNEDYFGKDSLWVRTINDYLAVQELPEGLPQHRALEALLKARQVEPTPEAKTEAADIRHALRALSVRGWKPWRSAFGPCEGHPYPFCDPKKRK
jgi:hypothetical protein